MLDSESLDFVSNRSCNSWCCNDCHRDHSARTVFGRRLRLEYRLRDEWYQPITATFRRSLEFGNKYLIPSGKHEVALHIAESRLPDNAPASPAQSVCQKMLKFGTLRLSTALSLKLHIYPATLIITAALINMAMLYRPLPFVEGQKQHCCPQTSYLGQSAIGQLPMLRFPLHGYVRCAADCGSRLARRGKRILCGRRVCAGEHPRNPVAAAHRGPPHRRSNRSEAPSEARRVHCRGAIRRHGLQPGSGLDW